MTYSFMSLLLCCVIEPAVGTSFVYQTYDTIKHFNVLISNVLLPHWIPFDSLQSLFPWVQKCIPSLAPAQAQS